MDVKMRRWGKHLTVFHRKADDMFWINFAMNWEAVEYILQENWNFPKNGRPTTLLDAPSYHRRQTSRLISLNAVAG